MLSSKYGGRIAALSMAAALLLCLLPTAFTPAAAADGTAADAGLAMEYATVLFDTQTPLVVDIIMDGADWEAMLENAMAENYYSCEVVIGGTRFHKVGIRPKGNTSLMSIAGDPDTERYSFKLEFDHFIEGQSCFGLDKLILNNNYADATNMKEALVYDMFAHLGADASLWNYAEIRVNGAYWGLYLALEAVEDSFLLRNYGLNGGRLYKPESVGGGPGGGGPGGDGGAAGLNYLGEDSENYSVLWEGAVGESGAADHARVVEALKNIAQGTELERYMDVDNLLRYMAVHTFCVNLDSLSGNMAHNYYLYEQDGRLNLLPWDYNLAFGGFSMGGGNKASAVVHFPIETPFSGVDMEERQFFAALLENEACMARYKEHLRALCEGYVQGGPFEARYAAIRSRIDALVQNDPTAFYDYAEYSAAADMLHETILLRAQSVLGQLEGSIPGSSAAQQAHPELLFEVSSIDPDAMGGFMHDGGEGMGTMRRGFGRAGGGQPPEGAAPGMGRGMVSDGFVPPAMGGPVASDGFAPPGMGGGGRGPMPPDGKRPGIPPGADGGRGGQGGVRAQWTAYLPYLPLLLAGIGAAFLFRRRRRLPPAGTGK